MKFKWTALLVLFFSLLLNFEDAIAGAWIHDPSKKWNEDAEVKYARWVETIGTDFLTSNAAGPFKNWSVDCADFIYLVRLIFAMNNGLEFVINDPLNSGRTISSARWSQGLLPFARYVINNTSTQTLPKDTYLVPIHQETVRPGVIVLGDKRRGHSMLVKKISRSGIPTLIYGSLPASEFLYLSYHFPDARSYFLMGPITIKRGGGLRQFKWPQHISKMQRLIPLASEDQLRLGKNLELFFDNVQERVRTEPANEDESFNYLVDDLCSQVRVRANAITDAVNFLETNSYRHLTAAEADRFSTYKRDESILRSIAKIRKHYLSGSKLLSDKTRARWESILVPKGTTEDECLVDWAVNRIEPLGWIIERFEGGKISSRVDASLSARWGL